MYQNQNGISSQFPSHNSSPSFSIESRPWSMALTVASSIGRIGALPDISVARNFCSVRKVSIFSFIVILLGEPTSKMCSRVDLT